jgi:hypothetical protein
MLLHRISKNMKRRQFLAISGGTIIIGGATFYLLSDKKNFTRADVKQEDLLKMSLKSDERAILHLASLAPSGHNTQPWFIKYIEPYHWIIGNDSTKWLPAVDPTQRETILSIGAFLQNLEYAANNLGYACQFNMLAKTNQDEHVIDVKLTKLLKNRAPQYISEKIEKRRTVRSNYLNTPLNRADISYLIDGEADCIQFIPNTSKEHKIINEQTIEANKIQAHRDVAQNELGNWIRFSNKNADKYRDGLTPASMEMHGMPAWIVRNFYDKSSVMKTDFREKGIETVVKQVSQSAGWLLITNKGNTIWELIETGMQLQRLWLSIREKNIAIHPMTQIIEEAATNQTLNQSIGVSDTVQFILRTGFIEKYPQPVTLRRGVDGFIRT